MEVFLPMDTYGLTVYTAGQLLWDLWIFLGVFLLTILIAWETAGNPVRMIETVVIAILAASAAAKNRFDNWKIRQKKQLLTQLFEYLDNLRHAYYRTMDVEEAVYEAWSQAGEEWKLQLAVMEEYLFTEGQPEVYRQNRPNPFFVSFLAICQCAIRYGDEEESSIFLDNLEELQKNIQMELLELEKEQELFFTVCAGMILPLLTLPWMERWSLAQISELEAFYAGSVGALVRILVCVLFWLCFQVFRSMKAGPWEQRQKRGRDFLLKWNRWEGAMGRWTAQIHRELNPGGGLQEFYDSRLKAAVITSSVGFSWMLGYELSLVWIPVFILLAAVASFLPYLKLLLSMEFYFHAREEEVAQFRSVLYMLSAVPQMNAELILEWLEQFAWYYKDRITQWIDRMGQDGWSEEMNEEEKDTAGFHRILEDIQASDRVGIREAFRDIVSKRDFWMARKRQQQELARKKKEIYVQAVLFVPFGAAIAAYLIAPFLYEGIQNLLSFTEMGVIK